MKRKEIERWQRRPWRRLQRRHVSPGAGLPVQWAACPTSLPQPGGSITNSDIHHLHVDREANLSTSTHEKVATKPLPPPPHKKKNEYLHYSTRKIPKDYMLCGCLLYFHLRLAISLSWCHVHMYMMKQINVHWNMSRNMWVMALSKYPNIYEASATTLGSVARFYLQWIK